KLPCDFDLNTRFAKEFQTVPKTDVTLWEAPAYHFSASLMPFFDIARSTPMQLVPQQTLAVQARLEPQCQSLNVKAGATVSLQVRVYNTSMALIDFVWPYFGVSYHLLSREGNILVFDHPRAYFNPPLKPGNDAVVPLSITAPDQAGSYLIEIDMVWEGIMWF